MIQSKRKKRCIEASLVFALVLFMTFAPLHFNLKGLLPKVFYLNTTPSLPVGLYLRVPAIHLEDGDAVVYRPSESTMQLAKDRDWIPSDEMFIKEVGALQHETYSINPDNLQFLANGKYIGQVSPIDHLGRMMPVLRGDFEVPDDEFLPVANNPSSFDGRYTGPVPTKNIEAKVIPLILEFHW